MANKLFKIKDEIAKELSGFKIISPDSPLRKQIESAIKSKVKLTKKQRPKIILVEEKTEKPIVEAKKTRKRATVKKELNVKTGLTTKKQFSTTE
jgi:hypothetical protein